MSEAGDASATTVLLLPGGGPGASAWSEFGRTLGEDGVNPHDDAFTLIPRAQLPVFCGCGHWAMLEKCYGFNRPTTDFLGAS